MNRFYVPFLIASLSIPGSSWAQKDVKWHPGHYALTIDHSLLSMGHNPAAAARFERWVASLPDEITGVQSGAYWSTLEPQKDRYDLSIIEEQLRICAKYKKRLFLTVSEKQFGTSDVPVPDYIVSDPQYRDGLVTFTDMPVTQARIWDPAVLGRFNRLLVQMGKRFDQEPYFEGVEFVETALRLDYKREKYDPAKYISSLKKRLAAAKKAFPTSVVIQETNWIPGAGPGDFADFFRFCHGIGVGIGGPDLIPDAERAAERPRIPAYEFFPAYAGKMPLASDVQSPEYQGRFGKGIFFGTLTPQGIFDMGVNTLKLNYIFWAACDWKNTDFTFSGDVLPYIRRMKGRMNTGRPANLKP